MFVRYAEHLKAYRLSDLKSNVIVESKDIEFFEDKLSYGYSSETSRQRQKLNIGKSQE